MTTKLLPKTIGDFSSDAYWKRFFRELDNSAESFEWYGSYPDLQKCLERYLKFSDQILQIGCGNSVLADHLYDNGFRQIVSVDIVDEVVRKQRQRNKKKRPELSFERRDVTQDLDLSQSPFNAVLDKGTLDALLCDDSDETSTKISLMFGQVEKNLTNGGRYIIVTLAQEHIVRKWISYFTGRCLLRVHHVETTKNNSEKYAVFLLIATKLRDGISVPEIYEFVSSSFATPKKCNSLEDLLSSIRAVQEFTLFCNKASAVNLTEDLQIQLYDSSSTEPIYNVILVQKRDDPKDGQPYGVFVVPKGNEKGYFYSSPTGRQELCKLSDFRRLAIVVQCGAAKHKTLDEVKEDLNSIMLKFAPSFLKDPSSAYVPYLSVGADQCGAENEGATKKVLEKFQSEISGDFEVIEVPAVDDALLAPKKGGERRRLRQLIFSCNVAVVQSEVKVTFDGRPDWSSLACLYHRAIVASLAIAHEDFLHAPLKICLLGLGGGCLATFLRKHFANAQITAIELDPVVVAAAEKYFDFKTDDKLTCLVEDGLKFLERRLAECGPGQYDVIILDVASSTPHEGGLTAPPPVFLEKTCMENIRQLLTEKGALALNLVVRCKERSLAIKRQMSDYFDTVMSHPVNDDTINELLVCLPYKPQDARELNDSLQLRLTQLHTYLAEICSQNNTQPTNNGQENPTPAHSNNNKSRKHRRKNK